MATMTKTDLEKLISDINGKALVEFKALLDAEAAERDKVEKAGPPDWARAMFSNHEGPMRAAQTWEKGQIATGVIGALAMTKADPERARAWVAKNFAPTHKAYADEVTKALLAGDSTSGGFLLPTILSQDLIELLRPASIVRRMGPTMIPMPNGSIRLPKLTAGSAATYIGETQNIGVTQPTFGQVVLTYKKLAALVPMSNDLLRQAALGTDSIVRNDLVRAIAQREDQAFIRDDGTAATPRGLRSWCLAANLLTTVGTWALLANIVTDLGTMVQVLRDANVPFTRPGWLMAPRTERILMTTQNAAGYYVFRTEMLTGKLWGFNYGVTTQIPTNLTGTGTGSEMYLVDFDDAAIGESLAMTVDASTDAAYDDNGTVRAAYSLDQTVIRAITEHDFAMRRDQSVCVMAILP